MWLRIWWDIISAVHEKTQTVTSGWMIFSNLNENFFFPASLLVSFLGEWFILMRCKVFEDWEWFWCCKFVWVVENCLWVWKWRFQFHFWWPSAWMFQKISQFSFKILLKNQEYALIQHLTLSKTYNSSTAS